MAWSFEWLRTWDAIWEPSHLERWRAMAEDPAAYATPFNHPDLVRGWLASMGGAAAYTPFFLHAAHSGGQRVLLPLVRPQPSRQPGLMRRLVPVGDGPRGPHFAYNDPLVMPAASADRPLEDSFWPAFERELQSHAGSWFDRCTLHRMRAECLGEGVVGDPVAKGSTYVRLDAYPDFEAYAAARPPVVASQVRRKLGRLEAEGRCGFHMYGPGELDQVLAWLPDLEAGRLARYPGSVVPPDYMRNLISAGFESGLVRCSVFRIDDRPASWRIDYLLNGTLYLCECSFDESFARHSPGQLHTWEILRWHMARGGRAYDALIGDQAYKYNWTDGAEHKLRLLNFDSRAPVTQARHHANRGLGVIRRLGQRAGALVGRD